MEENVVQLYMTDGEDEGSVLSGAEAFRKEFFLILLRAQRTFIDLYIVFNKKRTRRQAQGLVLCP